MIGSDPVISCDDFLVVILTTGNHKCCDNLFDNIIVKSTTIMIILEHHHGCNHDWRDCIKYHTILMQHQCAQDPYCLVVAV